MSDSYKSCIFCDVHLKQCSFAKLSKHIRSHTLEKPFHCNICGNSFTENFSKTNHVKLIHSKENHDRQVYLSNYRNCLFCKKPFKEPNELFRHMTSHTKEQPYTCKICLTDFASNSNKITHIRLIYFAPETTNFVCVFCSKKFKRYIHLDVHIRTHTEEKAYDCPQCGTSFNTVSQVKSHLMVRHTGELPYDCEVCYKRFRTKGHLTRHRRIHTGEKPFKCEICLRKFRVYDYLTSHIRVHTGEKPFKCPVCNKAFGSRTALHSHKFYHIAKSLRYKHQCLFCNKKFKTPSLLEDHIRFHINEKPFCCKTRQVSFFSKKSLRRNCRLTA